MCAVPEEDGMVKIYWGGADTVMWAATAKISDLVALVLECPRSPRRIRFTPEQLDTAVSKDTDSTVRLILPPNLFNQVLSSTWRLPPLSQ